MTNFFLARVSETLIRRQSRRSSPTWNDAMNQDKGFSLSTTGEVTHITDIIAPDHRDDDTILVSTLTLISRQDLDKRILFVDRG
jgi:hypothetical protein